VLLLGSRERATISTVHGRPIPATPERVFVIPPMLFDRFEYTVARYRDALRRGFVTELPPFANDERGFDEKRDNGLCTFSTAPFAGADSREEMPLTCIEWSTARDLCLFDGADLPTEASWEHAAMSSARPSKTSFPWGDQSPSCNEAVWGRLNEPLLGGPCLGSVETGGPLPVSAGARDVTPSGARGLAASVAEMMRDAFQPYSAACWAAAPLWDPTCVGDDSARTVLRGGAWTSAPLSSGAVRAPGRREDYASDGGFRCARR
jgi:formylglycine-generating enzyme required for sulfatase activity